MRPRMRWKAWRHSWPSASRCSRMADAGRQGAIAVTGAARGIGAAIALELARRGFSVGCLSRGARLPAGADKTMIAVDCDVADEASITRAVDTLAARAGGLRGIVNNAGIHKEGPSDRVALADY